MPDIFDVRRRFEEDEDPTEGLRSRRAEKAAELRERMKRLVPLRSTIFFDPLTREILRKVGSAFVFIRHDRRRTQRLTPDQAELGHLRLIQGGLFWDPSTNHIYQFRNGYYVLYSRDRRKKAGKSPVGGERRKAAKA